jgi:hypothetical protein
MVKYLKFKFHRANLTIEQSQRIQIRWKKTITDYGFCDTNFVVASESEGHFLGKHDGCLNEHRFEHPISDPLACSGVKCSSVS